MSSYWNLGNYSMEFKQTWFSQAAVHFPEKFCRIHMKTPICNSNKKRFHCSFPVNFVEILKIFSYKTPLVDCFCSFKQNTLLYMSLFPSVCPSVHSYFAEHISRTVHYLFIVFGTHMQNDDISRRFFHFSNFLFFGLLGGRVNKQKIAQNQK